MKRFNYEAISLIPGLVKLMERDNPDHSDMDTCALNIINEEVVQVWNKPASYEL